MKKVFFFYFSSLFLLFNVQCDCISQGLFNIDFTNISFAIDFECCLLSLFSWNYCDAKEQILRCSLQLLVRRQQRNIPTDDSINIFWFFFSFGADEQTMLTIDVHRFSCFSGAFIDVNLFFCVLDEGNSRWTYHLFSSQYTHETMMRCNFSAELLLDVRTSSDIFIPFYVRKVFSVPKCSVITCFDVQQNNQMMKWHETVRQSLDWI